MISPVRHSANLFAVALVLAVAGCQQQPGDDSAANTPGDSANLHEITLAVTGMT